MPPKFNIMINKIETSTKGYELFFTSQEPLSPSTLSPSSNRVFQKYS